MYFPLIPRYSPRYLPRYSSLSISVNKMNSGCFLILVYIKPFNSEISLETNQSSYHFMNDKIIDKLDSEGFNYKVTWKAGC